MYGIDSRASDACDSVKMKVCSICGLCFCERSGTVTSASAEEACLMRVQTIWWSVVLDRCDGTVEGTIDELIDVPGRSFQGSHRIRKNQFTVKIRSLYDYQLRLMQGVVPSPSGVDIAVTVKYLSQVLLNVLKDVPNSPFELLKSPEMDHVRLGLFPSLDYKGLYNSLIQLIEVASLIQYGLPVFGQSLLQCLGCLLPFLEHDLIDNLPYLTASTIAVLPSSLHQEIVNYLCFYILPFTVTRHGQKEQEICNSVSSVIMMIFQYSTNPAHHCQLLECLMTLKQNILKDILCVIAYGTSVARSSAAKLLFYYWPAFNPDLFDRKGLICKLAADAIAFPCQRTKCPNAGNVEAAKVCYDHCIAIEFSNETPPPLYLCIECANEIHRKHPNLMFFDILHPMQQVSMVCENKNCRSSHKYAISVCFSTECASYNGNRPIRYCEQCHNNRHNSRRGFDHIYHKCVPPTWSMDSEMLTYMVEAIISLLKEAKGQTASAESKEVEAEAKAIGSPHGADEVPLEERQLLGRYGVWLLVGRCTPDENTPDEVLGRLLAMLFHWFHMTAYSSDGQEESTLEKLKTENVCGWLRDISNNRYSLFISCLLPHPPDAVRVGGHWDTLASRTSHLKEGLHRLFCLVPYEVITQEIWDYVMPFWMEAIVNDVPEKELPELRIILSKILDTEMSPLGLDEQKMYHFVALRFDDTASYDQDHALHWLQMLTVLEIVIPLPLLFRIFNTGVRFMRRYSEMYEPKEKLRPHESKGSFTSLIDSANTSISDEEYNRAMTVPNGKEFETDTGRNLFCCILMLDILLQQIKLQNIDKHTGLGSSLCKEVCGLLKSMLSIASIVRHSCVAKSECEYCESSIMWHQLSLQLVKYLSPIYPAHPPDPPVDETSEDSHSRRSPPDSDKKDKSDVVLNMPVPEVHSVGGVLVHMPHVCSIMTATVETASEQLDLAAIIPAEKVVSAVARAITLSDGDVATATAQIVKPQVMGDSDEIIELDSSDSPEDFWHTSVGKFKFCIEDLPLPIQYIYQLLQQTPKVDKPDVLYYMLQCLNVLCLHGDACTRAAKDQRGFFIWCQENLLIRHLWELCDSEHSHICQEVVPLLLHCITLPAGSDVFWRIIQEDFHNPDWRIRFVAVERVTVIARFMDSSPLRNILPLQAALANAFCYLISSMDDPTVYVAQRATLYLGTVHDKAIKSLIMCLENQFDSVIVDRPMVLQSLYQLHNSLSERSILTWDFFLNRFDTLFLEAQITLEQNGDISVLRDLKNSDVNSDNFLRKLHRAQEALSQSDGSGTSSIKTLSASFGTKWPYKRTMSAPASIISRHESKEYKEKVYSRQYSAPILKRKSSRFGLDGHTHSLNIVEDQNLTNFLLKVIDLEEADRETMHLLVFLLMQFLSRSDQAFPADERVTSKTQGIVMRHLYLLLGYSQTDRAIHLPPHRIRSSPVFSAFLSNLPQVLDQNHVMGHMLLPTILILLQYSPSPYFLASTIDLQQPNYSLWMLESHFRRDWLVSLVVLLYKYQYSQHPYCTQLTSLIHIVLNTLNSQHHHCRRIPATIIVEQSVQYRSRDVSQPSLGTENEQANSPPLSPCYLSESVHVSLGSKGGKAQVIYTKASSSNMETHWEENVQADAEHLIVIPESEASADSSLLDGFRERLPHKPNLEDDWSMKTKVETQAKRDMIVDMDMKNQQKNCTKVILMTSLAKTSDLHRCSSSKSTKQRAVSHEFNCDEGRNRNGKIFPTPSLERLLPIGSNRVTTECMESPLEIPSQERLLPIGQRIKEPPQQSKDITQFVDKVKQALGIESRHKNEPEKREEVASTSHSPRRLIKQDALESPPNMHDPDFIGSFHKSKLDSQIREPYRHRSRKNGLYRTGSSSSRDFRKPGYWSEIGPSSKSEEAVKQSTFRIGEECVNNRCSECGLSLEEFSDEEIGLCIVVLGTFIHREPALAAPLLPHILGIVANVAQNSQYPWQTESSVHLPGGAASVAHQFLRCVLYQLAPNGIFTQMFQTHAPDKFREQFFKSVIQALVDFNELNPVMPLQMLLETMNSRKTLPLAAMPIILDNVACYLDCLPLEATLGPTTSIWSTILQQMEAFYRRIVLIITTQEDVTSLMNIIISVFKIPIVAQHKGILEPFSKVISYAIENCTVTYNCLLEMCFLCNRVFTKERDKLMVSRLVVYELVQALKCKVLIPDQNLLVLVNLILQDVGGSATNNTFAKEIKRFTIECTPVCNTSISDCMKLHLGDMVEFLTDFHVLARMKSYFKGSNVGLNDDTLGGIIKCAISQYLALEVTRGNGRDNRAVMRYFPWLYNSTTVQQTFVQFLQPYASRLYSDFALFFSPREFVDCVAHSRVLSWVILGSLTHTAQVGNVQGQTCSQPIPQEASCQIADHIQVVIAGFGEQPKVSVVHMSSLFHTFILCQLWTVYLEQSLNNHLPNSEAYHLTMNILFDFWDKVTPCILQLMQQSKILGEIICLHFLSMLEALLESQSTFVGKLLPLWTPVICSQQLPGHLQIRLQNCRNFAPILTNGPSADEEKIQAHNPVLLKWLQRLQFKMGQIELQSSTATQFYSL